MVIPTHLLAFCIHGIKFRVLFEMFNKREIGGVVGLFEDMLEIAAGLVRVNKQSEMEFLRHGDSVFSLTS